MKFLCQISGCLHKLFIFVQRLKSINIIGCGSTANHWPGKGDSLGVNDCEKTGKKVDNLLVIDWPLKFEPERFAIVHKSEAKFYSQLSAWQRYKEVNLISINRWRGHINGKPQFSSTSPFVAITLAQTWGYQEIILWGCDFIDHQTYKRGSESFAIEYWIYKNLYDELAKAGVKLYAGCPGSALDFLEIKPALVHG